MFDPENSIEKNAQEFRIRYQAVKDEITKVIVGHDEIINGVLTCLFVGGHTLIEGVPGLGKTLLVRVLSQVLDLKFSRIQFTPDLMPADVIGTNMITEDSDGRRSFEFQRGPIFSQIVLADEINRTTPKTQSALLEAMQEQTVTVGGIRHELVSPFLVLATQNPIDQEGTYPLPEAQLDRFFFKLLAGYPSRDELGEILNRTTLGGLPEVETVMDSKEILGWQQLIRSVIVSSHVQDYAIRLVMSSHPKSEYSPKITNQYVRWGSSPRGAQSLILAGKVHALLEGRYNVGFHDIRTVFLPALRHRMLLNFEAQAEGIQTDDVLRELLEKIPEQHEETSGSGS